MYSQLGGREDALPWTVEEAAGTSPVPSGIVDLMAADH